MKLIETPIRDLFIIEPAVFRDSRGYFFESFNAGKFHAAGLKYDFVQDNQSQSTKGTLRGLHFQFGPMAQSKLVWVSSGKVLDVAVDLRPQSPTYSKSFSLELSDQNFRQLLIPRGFAHGFLCLSETATFTYKCDNLYSKDHDGGIRWDDPELAIEWPKNTDTFLISDKDQALPYFRDVEGALTRQPF